MRKRFLAALAVIAAATGLLLAPSSPATATGPTLNITPTYPVFYVCTSTSPDSQTLTVKNTGSSSVTVTSTAFSQWSGETSAVWSITAGGGSFTLAAGATRGVTVEYDPAQDPAGRVAHVSLGFTTSAGTAFTKLGGLNALSHGCSGEPSLQDVLDANSNTGGGDSGLAIGTLPDDGDPTTSTTTIDNAWDFGSTVSTPVTCFKRYSASSPLTATVLGVFTGHTPNVLYDSNGQSLYTVLSVSASRDVPWIRTVSFDLPTSNPDNSPVGLWWSFGTTEDVDSTINGIPETTAAWLYTGHSYVIAPDTVGTGDGHAGSTEDWNDEPVLLTNALLTTC